jgi:hypothetical protein
LLEFGAAPKQVFVVAVGHGAVAAAAAKVGAVAVVQARVVEVAAVATAEVGAAAVVQARAAEVGVVVATADVGVVAVAWARAAVVGVVAATAEVGAAAVAEVGAAIPEAASLLAFLPPCPLITLLLLWHRSRPPTLSSGVLLLLLPLLLPPWSLLFSRAPNTLVHLLSCRHRQGLPRLSLRPCWPLSLDRRIPTTQYSMSSTSSGLASAKRSLYYKALLHSLSMIIELMD